MLVITSLLSQFTFFSIAYAASSSPYSIVFLASEPSANHYALWGSDGTEIGTQIIKDINPISGLDPYRVSGFHKAGSWLLFTANDGINGLELWRTDGTTAGTQMLKDLNGLPSSIDYCTYGDPGCDVMMCGGCPKFSCNGNSQCQQEYDMMCSTTGHCRCEERTCTSDSGSTKFGPFISNGTKVFFRVETNTWGGFELWVSDGTEAGTKKIKDFVSDGHTAQDYAVVGDLLYLGADDGTNVGLWVSDGTTAGTVFVAPIGNVYDFYFGWSASYMPFGNKLIFSEPFYDGNIWISDGTFLGTVKIVPKLTTDYHVLQAATSSYGFLTIGSSNQWDLYSMTGSVGEKTKLNIGSRDVGDGMAAIGDNVYFYTRINDYVGFGTDYVGPWVTDGTVGGTRQIAALYLGSYDSLLYSKGFSGGHNGYIFPWTGDHIWAMDSSENITLLLTGEYYGTSSWKPRFLADRDRTWFSFKKDGEFGLWVTDGTVGGTVRVKQVQFFDADYIYLTKLTDTTQSVDTTPPEVTVTGVADGAIYVLGSVPAAGCVTTDALSGVETNAALVMSGGNDNGVGTFTASCTGAMDKAGNAGTASVTYQVIYPYSEFSQPIDLPPTVNLVRAGASVPVKFSLAGDRGLAILAAGSPTSRRIDCAGGATNEVDDTELAVTAGNNGLHYDSTADQYIYVWKTDKALVGTCRQFTLTLNDGTTHPALFEFKK